METKIHCPRARSRRVRAPPPIERVRRALAGELPSEALDRLPRRYFRAGDVLLVDLPLPGRPERVAEAYAQALGMRSVLGLEGPIRGEYREPAARLLWGDPATETLHTEQGLQYRLDPARVMWSPGNLPERQRVAAWDCRGETVLDCFAGVGYFTIPLAARAGAARVVAIEKNPVAHAYLVENARLNGVADRVEPVLGDCREAAPQGEADRVLLGYLPDAADFVETAARALRSRGGLLHVHRVVRARTRPEAAFDAVARRVRETGRRARLVGHHRVKSYAPGRVHLVLDVQVTP